MVLVLVFTKCLLMGAPIVSESKLFATLPPKNLVPSEISIGCLLSTCGCTLAVGVVQTGLGNKDVLSHDDRVGTLAFVVQVVVFVV